jgi:glycosyltransferase involved in cell wall biosynthesis
MLVEPAVPPVDGSVRPLRVLHVVQRLKGGGAETVVRGLVAGLQREGSVAASVLSLYPDELSADERAQLGVPVTSLERRGRGDIAGFYPRLIRAIRDARPDVVHAHLHAGKYAGRIAAIAARAGVPLERIVVIPNGVAEPPAADRWQLRDELGLPREAFVAYLPARMTRQKNHVLALRAFASTYGTDPQARIVLAGSGELEAEIRAEADRLGLGTSALFLGFRDDAARLLRAMDVLVLPSVWERMPLALGEAMLAGIPVVTTPWNGSADFAGDGARAIVAADWSVASFAHALERAGDAAERAHISARALDFARVAFSLDACVARHVALYRELACPAP